MPTPKESNAGRNNSRSTNTASGCKTPRKRRCGFEAFHVSSTPFDCGILGIGNLVSKACLIKA
jgi:broad specificity polyphosphatase/5'/3'-nucleotidase SurE